MKLSTHPIADLMPNMSTGEFEALKSSIQKYGQEVPILLLNGQILDGRHRCRACIELGIEPLATEIDTRDPLALVFTLNIHRRHLDTGQIAMLAAKVTERGNKGGRPAKNITVKSFNSFPSTRAAAAAAGVAHSYISEAVAVLEFDEECGGSLADQVKSGERPLWDAYRYVLRERERLSKKAKTQAEVEKLSEPLPVPAPYKFTPPTPGEEDVPPGENNLDDEIERLASDPNPVAEVFREWAETQDPVELCKISWNADIGRAADAIESIWNRILGEARDKRAKDWEMLPEERRFIDALRRVAKEASKQFRPGVVVYLKPAKLVVEGDRE